MDSIADEYAMAYILAVRAEAWDEGYIAASGDALLDAGFEVFVEDADNPYREEI